jgi:hypothetical protein
MIPDDILMAYVDGELDASARAAVEKAASASAEVAGRLAAHQSLRERLAETFAGALAEPVPAHLVAAVGAGAPAPAPAQVLDLATARQARRGRLFAGAPCLAVGLAIGGGGVALRPQPVIVSKAGALVAQGALARALDRQLASSQDPQAAIRIGLTVRTRDGGYCRTFIDAPAHTAGLACRTEKAWNIPIAANSVADDGSGAYRTAADDIPASVIDGAQSVAAGPPLDARQEAAGLAGRWRARPRP